MTFLSIQLAMTVASTKRKKSEEEAKENSINYLFNELMTSPKATLTTMLHDATLPVFLVMGIASVASMVSNSVSNDNIPIVPNESKLFPRQKVFLVYCS